MASERRHSFKPTRYIYASLRKKEKIKMEERERMGSYVYDSKTYHLDGLYVGDPTTGSGFSLPTVAGNVGDVLTCQGNDNQAIWTSPGSASLPIALWPGCLLQNVNGSWQSSTSTTNQFLITPGGGNIPAFTLNVNTMNNGMGRIMFNVLVRNSNDTYDYINEYGIYTVNGGVVTYTPTDSGQKKSGASSIFPTITPNGNPIVQYVTKDPILSRSVSVNCTVVPHSQNAVSFT